MKTLVRDQYLMFDGIKLVSVFSAEAPFDQEFLKDVWHVPGNQIMGTEVLITLANERGVPLSRTTYDEGIATTVLLTLK